MQSGGMFSSVRRQKRYRLEIVSLTDVMTFLLFFFMLFTTFKMEPTGVSVALPKAATASSQAAEHIVITVDRSGKVYFGQLPATLAEVTERTKEALSDNPETLFIVKADKDIKVDTLVQTLDAVRLAGASRLALGVERKSR